jgi:lysozyme
MEPSAKLIDATAQAEGFSATPYWDVDGYSIGHGHHGPDVIPGMHWTLDQARLQLVVDIQSSADDVNRLVKVSLTQGQFDCLTDFRFNVGPGSFAGSTLLKILNQGDYDGAIAQLYRVDDEGKEHGWIFAGGEVSQGLKNRRLMEQGLWSEA